MIAFLRRTLVDSWVGRVIALIFILAFGAWGIGDMLQNIRGGDAATVATVAGRKIGVQELDQAYRRGLAEAAQATGGDPSQLDPQTKRQVGLQALQRLVVQAEIVAAAKRHGLVVPDQVIRDTIFSMPAVKGPDGQFSRALLNQRLQQAGLTEDRLIALLRDDLAAKGLIEPLRAGAQASDGLVRRAYDIESETRTADLATLPFPDPASIAPPDAAALQRYYDNHKDDFRTPEYRRIKAVILSPATIARDLPVSDADLKKAYDDQQARFDVPERRSVQVLLAADKAALAQAASLWQGGAAWTQVQAAAKGANPVTLDDARAAEFPSPELGRQVFAAAPGAVVGPVPADGQWALFKVGKVTPAQKQDLDHARDALRQEIAQARAAELVRDRATKLQDAIAGGGLDAVPSDLGAAAVEGTLDAQGNTQDGQPAPIPGSDALRSALIAKAFAQAPGGHPALQQGPDGSYYALDVESVTPPGARSLDAAHDQVLAAWRKQQARRLANEKAASLYAAAKAHGGLDAVAAQAGIAVTHSGAIGHRQAPDGVPQQLASLVFTLKAGESTMVETPDSFVVATLTGVQHPDPAQNKLAYQQLRSQLSAAMSDDIEVSYAGWLRDRDKPKVNGASVQALIGQ